MTTANEDWQPPDTLDGLAVLREKLRNAREARADVQRKIDELLAKRDTVRAQRKQKVADKASGEADYKDKDNKKDRDEIDDIGREIDHQIDDMSAIDARISDLERDEMVEKWKRHDEESAARASLITDKAAKVIRLYNEAFAAYKSLLEYHMLQKRAKGWKADLQRRIYERGDSGDVELTPTFVDAELTRIDVDKLAPYFPFETEITMEDLDSRIAAHRDPNWQPHGARKSE